MIEFGLSTSDFRQRYFEQQPFVRAKALPGAPMRWDELDALLQVVEPDESLLQLFNNGQVPPHLYINEGVELGRPRRRINKHGLYGLLRSGATMVFNRMENFSVPARRLCAEVGRFAGHQTTSNAYVSFGGSGTFGKHWDTHDVFALQLVGRKRWQVFAPTLPLPLSHQTSAPYQQQCPATPVLDCVLSAGDLLYVPRGWWHQTLPFDEASFHLSVGVYAPTFSDYLRWVMGQQLPMHLSARKGVPERAVDAAETSELMRALTQAVLDPQQLAAFQQDLAMRERLSGEFDIGLYLDRTTMLDDHTVVSRSSVYALHPEHGEVPVNGGQLRLEPVSRAVMTLLSTSLSMTLLQMSERLRQFPPQAIRAAVLDLARYELVNIERRR